MANIRKFFKKNITLLERGFIIVLVILFILTLPAEISGVIGAGLVDAPDILDYDDVEVDEVTIPVKAISVGEESNYTTLKYIGILMPEEMRNLTFLNLAEIEEIYVEEGQYVESGDPIAKVNTSSAEATLETRAAALNQAEASKNSAYQNLKAAELELNDVKSEDNDAQLEGLLLDMESKQQIMDNQKAALDQAEIDLAAGTITEEEYREINTAYIKAESDYRQAQIAYEVALSVDNTTNIRFAQIAYESANASYEASVAAYEVQRTMYNQAKESIDEGTLYANMNGYIISIVAGVGEIANPLVPVVVLGSEATVVTIGISQSDIRSIEVGDLASIALEDLDLAGEVISIAKVPDETSRTYEANISIKKEHTSFFIGESATVEIVTGEQLGIWLPIQSVLNDGQDYVYAIEHSRAVKKYVSLGDISNDKVQVIGLNAGELVVSEGMRSISSGTLLNVVNLDAED